MLPGLADVEPAGQRDPRHGGQIDRHQLPVHRPDLHVAEREQCRRLRRRTRRGTGVGRAAQVRRRGAAAGDQARTRIQSTGQPLRSRSVSKPSFPMSTLPVAALPSRGRRGPPDVQNHHERPVSAVACTGTGRRGGPGGAGGRPGLERHLRVHARAERSSALGRSISTRIVRGRGVDAVAMRGNRRADRRLAVAGVELDLGRVARPRAARRTASGTSQKTRTVSICWHGEQRRRPGGRRAPGPGRRG